MHHELRWQIGTAAVTLLHVRHTFERLDKCRGCRRNAMCTTLVSGNLPSGKKNSGNLELSNTQKQNSAAAGRLRHLWYRATIISVGDFGRSNTCISHSPRFMAALTTKER